MGPRTRLEANAGVGGTSTSGWPGSKSPFPRRDFVLSKFSEHVGHAKHGKGLDRDLLIAITSYELLLRILWHPYLTNHWSRCCNDWEGFIRTTTLWSFTLRRALVSGLDIALALVSMHWRSSHWDLWGWHHDLPAARPPFSVCSCFWSRHIFAFLVSILHCFPICYVPPSSSTPRHPCRLCIRLTWISSQHGSSRIESKSDLSSIRIEWGCPDTSGWVVTVKQNSSSSR